MKEARITLAVPKIESYHFGEIIIDGCRHSSDVIIGLKTTILPVNINELDAITEYAEQNGFFTIISPLHYHR